MVRRSDEDLHPRNGHTLVAGIVARISGCAKQKEISLDDQVDHGKEEVVDLYQGPTDYRIVATKGKGESLDRPELAKIEAMIRTRELDLLIMEDVGRLVRGAEAVRLWGVAVDHGTRCIAPNDCCDTADENWEQDLLEACAEHFEMYGAAWVSACEFASGFYKLTSQIRFDGAERRSKQTLYDMTRQRLAAGELADTIGCPGIGVNRPAPAPDPAVRRVSHEP